MGRREDWYQYAEMPEAMAAVRGVVSGARRVLNYGVSMGAYAAIRFADAVGATGVLALSPQYSVDPAKAPFEERWREDGRRIVWRPEIDGPIGSAVTPIVVFDTRSHDARHVEMIRNDIEIREIGVPNLGHPSTTVLAELGLLGPLVFESLDGTVDALAYARAIRARRFESSVYVSHLAEEQPRHRIRTAVALARRGLALSPVSPISLATLGHVLTLAGEYDEAIGHLRVADSQTAGGNPHIANRLAVALAGAGRVREAHAVARHIAAVHPHLVALPAIERRILRAWDPRMTTSRWRLRVGAAAIRLARLAPPARRL